jgi:hypothetical protein
VESVLAINYEADLAVIKVKGNNFPYLEVGDPDALRTAQRIYCIGSPLGLDNTISDGLVSNAKRVLDGFTYIQISAPIAPGSSGGALLNEYGQVVGVTTAGIADTSINLAVPVTNLAGAFRFTDARSIKYLEAHSHFGCIPASDVTYNRIETDGNTPVQTMQNDTIMYGTLKNAGDAHYYYLDVKDPAEMLVSLTTNERNSAGVKFEVTDPSGKVVLKSCHYSGEIFSLATGHGAAIGKYTVKIYSDANNASLANVKYELYWLYHLTYVESGYYGSSYEFEPNNTPEYANYLPDYFDYFAEFSSRNDVDYFKFTLTERSSYRAIIVTDYSTSVINAEVFDENNRSVGRFSFDGEVELFDAVLPAGTYYIRVSLKDNSAMKINDVYYISGWYI